MCNSSSSVLVLNRTSPSLLHTFVAYTTQLSFAIQHTRNSFLHPHISRKRLRASSCHLYNIRRIRKYLPRRSTETLIHALVSSRVDYCNSRLYGLPAYQLNKLQRAQNAAVRLIFQESKYCHVRPLLYNLQRLPVKFRIDFKILLLNV